MAIVLLVFDAKVIKKAFSSKFISLVFRKFSNFNLSFFQKISKFISQSSTTYYHFYAADFSNLRFEIISGDSSVIERIEKAFFIASNNNASRQISMSDSGFEYLGEHEWKEVAPSGIKLEDSSLFPIWPQTEITSRTAISSAEKTIQEAYSVIRNDFLNGKLYDLSETDKVNYGFVLFFDLISAYSNVLIAH